MLQSQTALRRRCLRILLSSCPQVLPAGIDLSPDACPSHIISNLGDFLSDKGWLVRALGPVPARSVYTNTSCRTKHPSPSLRTDSAKTYTDDGQVLERNFSVSPWIGRIHVPDAETAKDRHYEKGGDATGRPRAQSTKADDSFRSSLVGGISDGVCAHHRETVAGTELEKEKEKIADVSLNSSSYSSTGKNREWSGSSSFDSSDDSDLSEIDVIQLDSSDESDLSDLEILRSQDVRFETGNWPQIFEETHVSPLTEETAVLEENADERGELDVFESADLSLNEILLETDMSMNDLKEGESGPPYLHTLSLDEAYRILEKARAKDLRHVQVGDKCEWVDCMIFASGRSLRHIRGMADALVYSIKKSSRNVGSNTLPTVEGRDGEQWMVVDCGSLVVHLFVEEARRYFNLEEYWRSKLGAG